MIDEKIGSSLYSRIGTTQKSMPCARMQRANFSAVYALFGVVLIPVSFMAIRLAKSAIHPVVFTRHGPNFGGWILAAYIVSQVALLVLAYTLYRVELAGVTVLELAIVPDKSGGEARASLAQWRLA